MRRVLLVGSAILLVVVVSGCNKPPRNQDTPQALARKYAKAITDDDRDAFVDCLSVPPGFEPVANEIFDFSRSLLAFHSAIIAKHGDDGPARFQETKARADDPQTTLDFNVFGAHIFDPQWPEKLQITISGDSAAAADVLSGRSIQMTHRNGVWRIVVPGPVSDANESLRVWKQLTGLVRAETAAVQQGDSLDAVKTRMARGFMSALISSKSSDTHLPQTRPQKEDRAIQ